MQVQNNIASINAARNQGIETGKLKKSLEKLSSGFRIVRAGDDDLGRYAQQDQQPEPGDEKH